MGRIGPASRVELHALSLPEAPLKGKSRAFQASAQQRTGARRAARAAARVL
jgi:hypothetical protein